MNTIDRLPASLPPPITYSCKGVRAIVTLVALGALTAFALMCSGHLNSFPQDFLHGMTQWQGITALASTAAALVVAGAIIGRIVRDPKNGKFSGHDHLTPVVGYYEPNGSVSVKWEGYKDTSVVIDDEKRKSRHYNVFNYKHPVENEFIATSVFIYTPLVAAGSIAFRTASIALLPIYRAAVYLYQACTQKTTRTYSLIDIPMGIVSSIWGVVRTPFYMLALMMSAVYTCIDPVNGRKLGYLVELEWNQGQPLHESIWSAQCVGSFLEVKFMQDVYHKWREYGRPQFSIPGCWHPVSHISTTHPLQAETWSYHIIDKDGNLRPESNRQQQDTVYYGPPI